jgi:hypothetical protein
MSRDRKADPYAELDTVRIRLLLSSLVLALAAPATMTAQADTSPAPAPYVAPSFHCAKVHHYGNGKAPDPLTLKGDPLCVVYNKRDITLDNGGAARFLEAEPARFAVAGKCQYWQRDHWRVRVDRGLDAVVRWDGSYWFDITNGKGGAILRHFRIAGQKVGPKQAAAALSLLSPAVAKEIRTYGAHGGGGGASVTLPGGYPQCSIPSA